MERINLRRDQDFPVQLLEAYNDLKAQRAEELLALWKCVATQLTGAVPIHPSGLHSRGANFDPPGTGA